MKFKECKVQQGPNSLEELLEQVHQPMHVKTVAEIIQDYTVKETMVMLELAYLVEEPAMLYQGCQVWYHENNKHLDFVPCAVRPEVPYRCYGKN